jgi:hypothetical protein
MIARRDASPKCPIVGVEWTWGLGFNGPCTWYHGNKDVIPPKVMPHMCERSDSLTWAKELITLGLFKKKHAFVQ